MELLFQSPELKNIVLMERVSYKSIGFFIGTAFFHHINKELKALEIIHIIKTNDSYKILGCELSLEKKNQHFECYFVKRKFEKFIVIDFKDLKYFPQHLHKIASGNLALRPPFSL